MPAALRSPLLRRFVILFAVTYAAFGVASPFLPAFLASRGLDAQQIGVALAASTGIRLVSGPLASRLADRLAALRAVLAVAMVGAALLALCYLPVAGFLMLAAIAVLHAAALAPITTLADALALRAAVAPGAEAAQEPPSRAAPERRSGAGSGPDGFEYGWVRGSGSAAFILGSVVSGQAIAALGLAVIVALQSMLLMVAAGCAMLVPALAPGQGGDKARSAGSEQLGALLRLPAFRRLVLVAALVLGSHAMHDGFAVIRWSAAGIGPGTISVLWAESVAAEVVVFFVVGPAVVDRLGPAGAMALAAAAGALRWGAMAETADVTALALIQPLHGLTFALLHLACMRVLGRIVPRGLAATAQALYGTFVVGGATALLTLASGFAYARFGADGFWLMAVLSAMAVPLTLGLRGR